MKYVSEAKLKYFKEKLLNVFATKNHTHSISNVTNLQNELNNKMSNGSTIKAEQIGRGYISNYIYLNTHPENASALIPFVNNDIAFLLKRGGTCTVTMDNVVRNIDMNPAFDGSPSYCYMGSATQQTLIELKLHKTFAYGTTIYIDFGSLSWNPSNIKIEIKHIDNTNNTWHVCYNGNLIQPRIFTNDMGQNQKGFDQIRITINGEWKNGRIAAIGVLGYNSPGLRETFVARDGGKIYGSIVPNNNEVIELGSATNRFKTIYGNLDGNAKSSTNASKVNNHTVESNVPANAKFTDTVYSLPNASNTLGGVKSGGDVYISDGIITVNDDSHKHLANQIRFTDGKTFQEKYDLGQLTGPKGETGAPGKDGNDGAQGPQGDIGPQGPRGLQGLQGQQGLRGEQGPPGSNGRDGLTTSIRVNGSTYTHSNGTITLPDYPKGGVKIKQNVSVTPSYQGGTYPYKADVYIYGVSANDIADASLGMGVTCDEFEGTNTVTNGVELLFNSNPNKAVQFSYISVTKGEVI